MKNKILLGILVLALVFCVTPLATKAAINLPKVKNVKVSKKGQKYITLTWKKVKKASSYQVKVFNGKKKKLKIVKAKKRTKKIKKLKADRRYYFKVRAKKKKKTGPWSKYKKGITNSADVDEDVDEDEDGDDGAPVTMFTISSTAFDDNGNIPVQYTCDGADISPPLSWTNTPTGTESFALIVRDIDVSTGDGEWIHWAVKDISSSATEVAENAIPTSGDELPGDWTPQESYGGPCPPIAEGAHSYQFEIYALNTATITATTADELIASLQSASIGSDYITGEYDSN